jgi:hypothetical protein
VADAGSSVAVFRRALPPRRGRLRVRSWFPVPAIKGAKSTAARLGIGRT